MPDPQPDLVFIEALAEVEKKALELRQALAEVARLSPQDPTAFLDTFADTRVSEHLGAILLLCDGNSHVARTAIDETSRALAQHVKNETMICVADGLLRGMARSAMSCVCGACQFCATRAKFKTEEARRRHITNSLRNIVSVPQANAGLVDPRGKILS